MHKQTMCMIGLVVSILFAVGSKTEKEEDKYKTLSTEQAIVAIQEKYKLPSLCLAFVTEDSVLVKVENGKISSKNTKKVTSSMQYQIGSLTKAFTSYTAASLVEEGKIKWDALLLDIIPELKESALKEYATVSLADLLSHRAGLPDYTTVESLNTLATEKTGSDGVLLATQLVKEKPVTESTFLYSNVGYSLASLMLERVSGKPWKELIDMYIAEPYGIEYSLGYPANEGVTNPAGHILKDYLYIEGVGCALPPVIEPSGGISMSLENLIIWSRVQLAQLAGKGSLSKENGEAIFFHPEQKGWYSFDYYNTYVTGYSMGWFNFTMGDDEYIGHGGSNESYYASIGINLTNKRALVFVINAYSDSVEEAAREICALIHERSIL